MRPAEESAGAAAGGRASRSIPTAPIDRCCHKLPCRGSPPSGRRPPPHGSKPNETTVTGGTRLRAAFVPIAPHARPARPRPRIYDRAVSSVLFVGEGRHQRRAIAHASERGLRVVAVDRNADAPGLALADVPEVVDFADVDAVEHLARRHHVNGALTVSADRAAPVVAAVSERLGLPTIGTDVAHSMTNKIAIRRTLAEEGIPQPPFAAVRNLAEG